MKKFIIALAVILIGISSVYSQSLKSISGNREALIQKSNEELSINLKLNYYFHFPDSYIIEYGYGFLGEFQLMTSKKFGWLFTANILSHSRIDHDGIYYTKFGGLILTIGPKIYFNNSNLRGYSSFGVGYRIGGQYSALTMTTALGMDYKLNNSIKLNIETKYNFYLHYTGAYSQSIFINTGIGIIL